MQLYTYSARIPNPAPSTAMSLELDLCPGANRRMANQKKITTIIYTVVSYSVTCAMHAQQSQTKEMLWEHTKGTTATKYHFKLGESFKASTFIPNAPTRNVSGRKINVIQLSRHKLAFNSRECFESRIETDLYI